MLQHSTSPFSIYDTLLSMKSIVKIILFPTITLALGLLLRPIDSVQGNSVNRYPEHLTGAFTGGFGEETCRSCHFDYPLNYKEGTLQVEGFPGSYERGQSYTIRIHVKRPDLAKAGFQLSARFSDGRQAGTLSPQSDRTQFTETTPDSIQYLQHSAKGTELNGETSSEWQLKWIAPQKLGIVYINLAANASNGDASEFGDYILTDSLTISPASP